MVSEQEHLGGALALGSCCKPSCTYNEVVVGVQTHVQVERCLAQACTPLLEMICCWLFEGRLASAAGDFFIVSNPLPTGNLSWKRRFTCSPFSFHEPVTHGHAMYTTRRHL